MDNVIQQLIDIENRAQRAIKDSKELEINFDKVVNDSVTDIKKQIEEKVGKRIESINSFERADADKKISEIKNSVSEEREKLLQKQKENHDKWVSEIFNEIISI